MAQPMEPTLHSIIERNAQWCPDAPAMMEGERELSWRELIALVAAVRQGLARQGIARGDRVAVVERNSIEQVALGYALAGLGAVIIPINWRYRADEIAYLIAHAKPAAAVVAQEFRATFLTALETAPAPRLLVARHGPAPAPDGWIAWDALIAPGAPVDETRAESWDDPHMILYTSGTTGRPKGAILSHRRTMLDAYGALAAFAVRPDERFLNYLPLFHTGAWDYIKQYFLVGGSIVLMPAFDADEMVGLLQRHRCTATFGVPLVLQEVVRCKSFQTADLSSLKRVAFGSYDPTELIGRVREALRARGAVDVGFQHAYGLSEAGPFVTISPYETGADRAGAVGLPVAGVTIGLLDDDLQEVAPGGVGEICVRSRAVMDGYVDDPEATAEAFRGGWLHTGDLGTIVDGQLQVVDRTKDMIRTGAENVYPKEVERVLVEMEGVADCAVIGVRDATWDERVVAVVVAEPAAELTEAAVIAYVRERLATFKAPREVHVVDEIPKTPAGKTAKHKLRERFDTLAAAERSAAAPS